jgi:Uri superfamily endonuclease
MTDLTERLDRHLLNDDAEQRHWDADSLIEEALAEIQRLTNVVEEIARHAERTDGYGVPVWESGPGIAMEIRAKFLKKKL